MSDLFASHVPGEGHFTPGGYLLVSHIRKSVWSWYFLLTKSFIDFDRFFLKKAGFSLKMHEILRQWKTPRSPELFVCYVEMPHYQHVQNVLETLLLVRVAAVGSCQLNFFGLCHVSKVRLGELSFSILGTGVEEFTKLSRIWHPFQGSKKSNTPTLSYIAWNYYKNWAMPKAICSQDKSNWNDSKDHKEPSPTISNDFFSVWWI